MEARRIEKKKSRKDKIIEEIDEEDEDEEEEDERGGNNAEEDKMKVIGVGGRRGSGGYGVSSPSCQADRCGSDLIGARRYHRRHKVCEFHSKASVVMVAGLRQRFCQQCSRFHELRAFDEAKRSCRRRLAEHNERRRKSTAENYNDGSKGHQHDAMEGHCRYVVDDRGSRAHQMNINSGSSGCKSFHIK